MRMHVILLSLGSETCAGKRVSGGEPGDNRVTQAGCKWVNTLYVTMLVNVVLGLLPCIGGRGIGQGDPLVLELPLGTI